MVSRRKKAARVLVALALGVVALGAAIDEPRPATGRTGRDAERLTRLLEDETRVAAWRETKAVSFRFFSGADYLWDRERDYVRVRARGAEVQLPLSGGRAVILDEGREVRDTDERRRLREAAYAMFVNDSFWLNPFAKLRDPGVTRSVIQRHGRDALLVEYASGGLTPGDAYVYMPAHDREPIRWAMFVKVLPIDGIEATWEDFRELESGAKVAVRHRNGPLGVTMIRQVRGARSLRALVGDDDPFAELARLNARP